MWLGPLEVLHLSILIIQITQKRSLVALSNSSIQVVSTLEGAKTVTRNNKKSDSENLLQTEQLPQAFLVNQSTIVL